MLSEHRLEPERDKEAKVEAKEETKEEETEVEQPYDVCEGSFPDSHYPPPPILEEEMPDDLPQEENEETPTEDEWLCLLCGKSPCLFLQWQEELERVVDIMYPEVTNKAKRYHMYRHMSRQLHGPSGKHNRKPLPICFSNGLRDLFPSKDYVGFQPSPFQSGPRGDCNRGRDDGSTYQ